MRWNKKYKKFTLASFLLGGHFNPKVLYLTYKAEQLINYELFKKINKKFENNKVIILNTWMFHVILPEHFITQKC